MTSITPDPTIPIGDGRPAPPAPPAFDALLPTDMAAKAARVGEQKAGLGTFETFALAVLAGAFIGLGAMFSTVVTAGTQEVAFGFTRLLAGLTFSLGLILVVVAGAELFTGNNLIVMAWAEKRVPLARLGRNWAIVYAGNFVGAVATAALVFAGREYDYGGGAVGLNALKIAESKAGLGFGQAIALGILCNALVCLAIWLTYSARSVTDKVLAIVFPITAFVAAGFEHSVANMYFLPFGILVREGAPDSFWQTTGVSASQFPDVTAGHAAIANLLPVTIGNIVGGGVMVGLVYWLIYRRGRR